MKITDVITHQLVVNVDEPFTSSRNWIYKTKDVLVVETRADAGISGIDIALWDIIGKACGQPIYKLKSDGLQFTG